MNQEKPEILYVPQKKLEELAELNCCAELAESDKVKERQVFPFQRKSDLYICTGAISYKLQIQQLELEQVVPLENFKGTLKPLFRGEHWQEVDLKRRPRSYIGRIIIWKKRKMVICRKVVLLPVPGTENIGVEQLKLF